jgi:hypothetical protein
LPKAKVIAGGHYKNFPERNSHSPVCPDRRPP